MVEKAKIVRHLQAELSKTRHTKRTPDAASKRITPTTSHVVVQRSVFDQEDWCRIALRICRDTTNPYKVPDACSACPDYRSAMEEREFDNNGF